MRTFWRFRCRSSSCCLNCLVLGSSAKLRELRMIKSFTLKEQSQFGQIQLSVWKNWRMLFANWLICAASNVWHIVNALILVYCLSQFTWILNNCSNSLITRKEKTKKIITEKEGWICDRSYHKIRWTLAINALRSYVKHSKEHFMMYPNTSKLVKKLVCAPFFQSTSQCLDIRWNTPRCKVKRTLYDLHCPYFSPNVMANWRRRARGHFVTLNM